MVIPINEILGTLALILGVTGCLLNNRKLRICFIVWLISNALNGIVHVRVDVWSLLVRDVVFSILVIEGYVKWGKGNKMKRIKLIQGQFAIVDYKNYKWLNQWKWFAHWDKTAKSFYAVRQDKRINGRQHPISMSREILGLKRGDKRQSDHINHKTLDNREANLRIVTNQQNHFNRKNPKGYCWHRRDKKYQASIGVNGKKIHLGLFDTTREARNSYLKAKEKYHKI